MNANQPKHLLWTVLLFFVPTLWHCSRPEPQTTEIKGETMGTSYIVKVVSDRAVDAKTLADGIQAKLDLVDHLMSNWSPTSEISQFNQLGPDQELDVDPHTAKVVKSALEFGKLTHGAFDITIAPLLDLWGFGAQSKGPALPSDEEIAATMLRVGYQKVSVEGTHLRKTAPDMTISLAGLGTGYAVDLVYDYLVGQGFRNFMIDVSGDGRFSGTNAAGEPWKIALEVPDSATRNQIYDITLLSNVAMATSGDYRNYFERDGVRYCHILDPRTGRPIASRIAAVSVVTPDCLTADALSTSLSVLGPEDALALVESLPGIECYIILHKQGGGFETRLSSGMAKYLQPKP